MSKSSVKVSPWRRYVTVFFWTWLLVMLCAYFFVEDIREAIHQLLYQFLDGP